MKRFLSVLLVLSLTIIPASAAFTVEDPNLSIEQAAIATAPDQTLASIEEAEKISSEPAIAIAEQELLPLAVPTITDMEFVRTSATTFTVNFTSDNVGIIMVWVFEANNEFEYYNGEQINEYITVGNNSTSFTLKGVNLDSPDIAKVIHWQAGHPDGYTADITDTLPAWSPPATDTMPPALSGGKFEWVYDAGAQRDVATFTFSSDEDGWLFIDMVTHGSAAPDLSYISGITNPTDPVSAGVTTFQNYMYLSGSPAMDYYVSVRDAAGNVSQPLAISVTSRTDIFNVLDSPFVPNTWRLYCEVFNLVGVDAVQISISYPYENGTLVEYWTTFDTDDSLFVPPTTEVKGGLTVDVSGLADTSDDRFGAGLDWSKSFAGQATVTVAVDGVTRYTTTITGTAPIPQPSNAKNIASFVIDGTPGVISGTSIDITVPYGTDITSLEPVIVHSGASVSPTGPQNFTSPVTYTVTAEDATTKGYTVTVTVLSEPVTQHEGGDRYDTAVRASQKAYPDPSEADAVILAYSQNFPDALAASYLAGALDAPILLSDTSGMDEVTEAEIKRLSPSTVYIVGGTGSISEGVKDTLEAYDFAPAVVRLGGAGREETAYEIAKAAKEMGSAPTTAFVADAANFPDALSAGSLSAGQGVPILLTATGSLDEWTQRFLEENDISDIIIVGGSGSVSETVATQLRALSHNPTVTRWSGSDRYATSADVLTKAIAKWNLTPTIIGLASGEGFPDALVGGAAVGNRGGLLAITDPDTLSAAAEGVISTYKDGISDVEIFGGTGTIRIADKVQGLLA